jgi:hypothetical protein
MLYMSLGAGATEPDLSSTSSLGFGTASDFIMRTLIMDFRDHTRKKLDDILKFGVVRFNLCRRLQFGAWEPSNAPHLGHYRSNDANNLPI